MTMQVKTYLIASFVIVLVFEGQISVAHGQDPQSRGAVVRDHRAESDSIVRDHRTKTRDHRAQQIEMTTASLVSFWNSNRGDNFTAATAVGKQTAINGGYSAVRIEASIFAEQVPGTVPLELYWSADRADNFSTATTAGKESALAAGYRFVRVQGYVYSMKMEGTIPLKLYWSPSREDNFTTATSEGERNARAAKYRFARIEGYVLPASAAVEAEDGRIEEMERERRKLEQELRERLGRYRPPAQRQPGPPLEEECDGDEVPSCLQAGNQTLLCDPVVSRDISPGGDVEVHFANGDIWTITTQGREIYTAPDGRRCRFRWMMERTALPPAEPPTDIGDSEWVGQVNDWLDTVGMRLLQRIEALVGADGLKNYQSVENERGADLYQRVDLRLAYLDRLMEHL